MSVSAAILFAALSSADAIATLLNSPAACGPERYAEARAQVEREAAAGRSLQQFVIGVTTDDKALADRYLSASRAIIRRMAEDRGNTLAWYLLSLERNDLRMLHLAARGGNVQALNALGSLAVNEAMHMKGASTNDSARVLRQCFTYFNRAAAQNDANGYINLGACYLNGFGCDRDLRMAFRCFMEAAKQGHPEGMENLSAAYELGHGVEKDIEQSAIWRMRAKAARGDVDARRWVAERERLKVGK